MRRRGRGGGDVARGWGGRGRGAEVEVVMRKGAAEVGLWGDIIVYISMRIFG